MVHDQQQQQQSMPQARSPADVCSDCTHMHNVLFAGKGQNKRMREMGVHGEAGRPGHGDGEGRWRGCTSVCGCLCRRQRLRLSLDLSRHCHDRRLREEPGPSGGRESGSVSETVGRESNRQSSRRRCRRHRHRHRHLREQEAGTLRDPVDTVAQIASFASSALAPAPSLTGASLPASERLC